MKIVGEGATKLNLVLMLGSAINPAPSPIEERLDKLLHLTAQTTLQTALASGHFSQLLALTNDPLFQPPPGVILKREIISNNPFHFGRALQKIAACLPPQEALFYLGAGAGLLLGQLEYEGLLTALRAGPAVVTANNYFSADFVGWRPVQALLDLPDEELPTSDNNLAWVLCRKAGLSWQALLPDSKRSLAMQFDIDTPTDAAILNLWLAQKASNWPQLAEVATFLANCPELEAIPVKEMLAALDDFESEVLVCGRVSAGVHRALEVSSHGPTRVLSEERGMRADGREGRGGVQSLAGFILEELGPTRFFEKLAKSADAAIIDSRVLFAHLKLRPSRADRFNSDIFRPDLIEDPVIKAFTEAALEARLRWNFPVLLGGHSAVAGSLLLLLELVPAKAFS